MMLPRLALFLLAAMPLHAQTYTWDGDLSGNWNTASNWFSTPASGQNTILSFGSSANTTHNNNIPIAQFLLNSLSFNASAPGYTLSGNPLNFLNSSTGTAPTIDSASGGALFINMNIILSNTLSITGSGSGNISLNGIISGPGGLTINSPRNVFLNNSGNTYSGLTTITNGTLVLGHGSALPSGADVVVANNGTLNLGTVSNVSSDSLGTVTLNGGSIRVPNGSGNYHINQLVATTGIVNTLGADAFTFRFFGSGAGITATGASDFGGSSNSRIANETAAALPVVVNAGMFGGFLNVGMQFSNVGLNANYLKQGNGTLILNNTANSGNFQLDAGTISLSNIAALGSGTWTLRNGSSGATLLYNGSANATTNKPLSIGAGGARFSVTPDQRILTFSGVLAESVALAPIFISGSSNPEGRSGIALSNNNVLTGAFTVINSGVLAVPTIGNNGTPQPLGSSPSAASAKIILGDSSTPGTFRLTGTGLQYSTDLIIKASDSGSQLNRIDISNPFTTLSLTKSITGGGFISYPIVAKVGPGTLALNTIAPNTTYADFDVQEGTLAISAAGPAWFGAATVRAGATFSTGGVDNTISGPETYPNINILGGTLRVPGGTGTYTFGDSYAGISMTGGTIDMTGANQATLRIAPSNNIGSFANLFRTRAHHTTATVIGSSTATLQITDLDVERGTTPNDIDLDVSVKFNFSGVKTGAGTVRFGNFDSFLFFPELREGKIRIDSGGLMADNAIRFAGGTLQYGGPTAGLSGFYQFTATGGTIEVLNPNTILFLSTAESVGGQGPLSKTGPGVLSLTQINPTAFANSITIHQGAIQVGDNASLGHLLNTITVNPGGELRFLDNIITSRFIQATTGTVTVSPEKTLTLQGANIFGGYLVGQFATAGSAVTSISGSTIPSTTSLTLSGISTLSNITQGGQLTVPQFTSGHKFTNLTNTPSGRMIISGSVIVRDFTNQGQLTISGGALPQAAGSMATTFGPVYLGGGSITIIGNQNAPYGLLNLNLHSLEVMGGLVINNASPPDFSNINAGIIHGNIRVNFNGLAKGNGFYWSVETLNGGQYSPGNSPGPGTVGTFAINPGGTFLFEINDATGVAGPSGANTRGWDKVNVLSAITFTATPGSKFNINVKTLLAPSGDTAGPMDNFNPNLPYSWVIFERIGNAALVGTFDLNAFNINTAQFANPINGSFSVQQNGSFISLVYTPVPEPLLMLPCVLFMLTFRRK